MRSFIKRSLQRNIIFFHLCLQLSIGLLVGYSLNYDVNIRYGRNLVGILGLKYIYTFVVQTQKMQLSARIFNNFLKSRGMLLGDNIVIYNVHKVSGQFIRHNISVKYVDNSIN